MNLHEFKERMKRVYTVASMAGYPPPSYGRAIQIAERFTVDQLDRMIRNLVSHPRPTSNLIDLELVRQKKHLTLYVKSSKV